MRSLIVLFFALLLSACAQQVPPLNFSVPNVGPSGYKISAEVRSITVAHARPDEQKGQLTAGMEAIPVLWKSSLEEALNKSVIFQDDAPKKVSISVKILKLDAPSVGFDMTTEAAARYEIIDRNDGAIIFTSDIDSTGVTPVDFAFLGLARARESVNRAVQNNILKFMQQLETVDIKRPMFPTKTAKAN